MESRYQLRETPVSWKFEIDTCTDTDLLSYKRMQHLYKVQMHIRGDRVNIVRSLITVVWVVLYPTTRMDRT
jgi:hypothetical protein